MVNLVPFTGNILIYKKGNGFNINWSSNISKETSWKLEWELKNGRAALIEHEIQFICTKKGWLRSLLTLRGKLSEVMTKYGTNAFRIKSFFKNRKKSSERFERCTSYFLSLL